MFKENLFHSVNFRNENGWTSENYDWPILRERVKTTSDRSSANEWKLRVTDPQWTSELNISDRDVDKLDFTEWKRFYFSSSWIF